MPAVMAIDHEVRDGVFTLHCRYDASTDPGDPQVVEIIQRFLQEVATEVERISDAFGSTPPDDQTMIDLSLSVRARTRDGRQDVHWARYAMDPLIEGIKG